MKLFIRFLSLAIGLTIYSGISYAATLNLSNGILMGVTGVDVNGTLYDVAFKEGTCAQQFGGYASNSDFTFANPNNDPTQINTAMIALLDQVFIDSPLGAFDTNPALIKGW